MPLETGRITLIQSVGTLSRPQRSEVPAVLFHVKHSYAFTTAVFRRASRRR